MSIDKHAIFLKNSQKFLCVTICTNTASRMQMEEMVSKTGSTSMALLSADERFCLLEVLDALQSVNSAEQFLACINGTLQRLLPHRRLACGIGDIGGDRVRPTHILLHDFPRQYLAELAQLDGTVDSPLMRRWRAACEPVLVELERDTAGVVMSYIARIRKYHFKNAAVHGLVDLQGAMASFFCFVDIPEKLGPRHAYLLRFLVPHLHVALIRSMDTMEKMNSASDAQELLSDRQKEVLYWIYKGKTNWEIASIMGLSEYATKYHVSHILAKLNVANRAQAVNKGLELKLIVPRV